MLPSTRDYSSSDRRVNANLSAHRHPGVSEALSQVTAQAPTSRAGSGDAKWAKGYSQGVELGRQMAAARGLNVEGQEK
jgi:hypothetical protein